MFAFQERRVERSEWLRVLPNEVLLPVLTQVLAMSCDNLAGKDWLVNVNFCKSESILCGFFDFCEFFAILAVCHPF